MKSVFQNLTLFTLILTPQIYPQSWWQQHGQNIINCGFVLHVAGSAITIAILLKKITALEKTQKQQATPENLVTKNELETNYVKKTDLNTLFIVIPFYSIKNPVFLTGFFCYLI
ncbi:MAG: hypothetical protein M1114_02380 [Candidatus Dependentiae bacterium]|nr:hypothetical protein [Candidatus Dependentiae bacterium]